MKLCVIGPYDRYNYGDLLFPYIIEYYFSDYYDSISYYSTIEAKMSMYGGKDTKKISDILLLDKDLPYDIIVAGGESIGASWGALASFISKPYGVLRKFILRFPFFIFIDNYVGKLILKGSSYLPLVVTHSDFPYARKIMYNSLGGQLSKRFLLCKRLFEGLKQVNYVSIRDQISFQSFKKIRSDIFLVPDCALLMSEIYTKEILLSKIAFNLKKELSSNYFVFQINKTEGLKNINECIDLIENICRNTGYKVVLCVIGYANLHEDDVPLRIIYNSIKCDKILLDNNTIWDIMYAISCSKFYIGTSLHGIITAMSYKIPYIGLIRYKIDNYLRTWGVEGYNRAFKINEVQDLIMNMDENKLTVDLFNSFNFQRDIVLSSFKLMKK